MRGLKELMNHKKDNHEIMVLSVKKDLKKDMGFYFSYKEKDIKNSDTYLGHIDLNKDELILSNNGFNDFIDFWPQ